MLGKRGRAPTMKRTTSMTGIYVDQPWPSDPQNPLLEELRSPVGVPDGHIMMGSTWNDLPSPVMISPRFSGDWRRQETSPFLRTCGLCSRRLAPSRDIYMYRGDTAFCSEECREQQIKQDERKEKCSIGKSKKVESHYNPSDLTSESSSNGETVAAA